MYFHRLLSSEYISHDYVHNHAQMAQVVQPVAMDLKFERSYPKAGNSLFSNMD